MGSNIGTGVGPRCHGAIDRNMGGKTRRRCFLMAVIASDGREQGKNYLFWESKIDLDPCSHQSQLRLNLGKKR